MKRHLLLFTLCFVFCHSLSAQNRILYSHDAAGNRILRQLGNNQGGWDSSLSFNVKVPQIISKQESNIIITFIITNNSQENIVIPNPRYWCNAIPVLKKDSLCIHLNRIRCNTCHTKDSLIIQHNSEFSIDYSIPLDLLVNIKYLTPGLYSIYFIIISNNNLLYKSTVSIFEIIE